MSTQRNVYVRHCLPVQIIAKQIKRESIHHGNLIPSTESQNLSDTDDKQ